MVEKAKPLNGVKAAAAAARMRNVEVKMFLPFVKRTGDGWRRPIVMVGGGGGGALSPAHIANTVLYTHAHIENYTYTLTL